MPWTIVRHGNPTAGEHMLGEVCVTFDETGTAVVEDDAAVTAARAFPGYFTVTEGAPAAPAPVEDAPPAPPAEASADAPAPEAAGSVPATGGGPYSAADLEEMTVADLREIATLLEVTVTSRMTKAELIAAILAAQEPPLLQE